MSVHLVLGVGERREVGGGEICMVYMRSVFALRIGIMHLRRFARPPGHLNA